VLNPVESHSAVVPREVADATETAASRPRADDIRTLAAGEILFREGEPRSHVYCVETGALCLYRSLPDGSQDVLEFAFPGDLIGLGYLDSHVSAAQATMGTTLRCLPREALDPALDESARSRLTVAIEREVAFLKDALVQRARPGPLRRVAALFVTLSHHNGYEGRDPAVITDSLKCGAAAGHLGMSVDVLGQQLAELEARGLIEPCEKGLRLLDIDTLLRLADGLD
jgi:CRP/FNR family transcriptional regulator, anaerobic regulatory protein